MLKNKFYQLIMIHHRQDRALTATLATVMLDPAPRVAVVMIVCRICWLGFTLSGNEGMK
jgi:hypothetical protein